MEEDETWWYNQQAKAYGKGRAWWSQDLRACNAVPSNCTMAGNRGDGSRTMSQIELIQCMFCGSTDGAYNGVCNYHCMIYQNDDDFNDYCKKFNELEEAKRKLLEKMKWSITILILF